jgi:HK97 gp10 family phage protein
MAGRSRGGRGRSSGGGGAMSVNLQGLDQLREKLAELAPGLIEAARKTVKESAEAVRDETKRDVVVDSGNLRDSADIQYEDEGLRAEIGWRDRDDWYASLREYGTRRRSAVPVLGPALEKERAKIEDRLKANVREVLP